MTINTQVPSYIQTPGNGVSTVFNFPFKVFASTDVVVGFVSGGNYALQSSGYTVTNIDVNGGGTLTFAVAPGAGITVDIRTVTPLIQPTEFANLGQFLPEAHTDAFDRVVRELQDLYRTTFTFGIHGPDTETVPWPALPGPSQRLGQGLIFDPVTGLPALGLLISQPLTLALLAPFLNLNATPQEIANGIVPVNLGYVPGDVRRYGFVGNGAIDDTVSVQSALTASAGTAYHVYVPNTGAAGIINGMLTAAASTHVVMEEGATLQWASTNPVGPNLLGTPTRPGVLITGNNFLLEGRGTVKGPQTAAAHSGAGGGGVLAVSTNEFAFLRIGTSAASRGKGIRIRDVDISLWGQGGIATQYMEDIHIIGCSIHDVGYQGITNLSAQNVRVHKNRVFGVAPGISGNAYGIQHTHDSTNYSGDPNVTLFPRQTQNPFCIDVDVSFNEVRDIPVWNGIDFHGGYECQARGNRVYNCHRAIQLSGSSGAAINYAGENNHVIDNDIYASQINGNPTTDISGFQAGIVVNGGATLTHRGIVVRGNHLYGVGHASLTPSVYCVEASFCSGLVFAENTYHGCLGVGLYATVSSGILNDNFFDSIGTSSIGSFIFYLDSNCSSFGIQGNIHNPISGTGQPYTNGLTMPGSGYGRVTISGNDFTPCTTPYNGVAGLTRGSSELVATVNDLTTGAHTGSIATAGPAPQVNYIYNGASAATLTSLSGGTPGQTVVIYVASNTTFTINDTGSTIRLTGGTCTLNQFGTLTLLCTAVSGNPSFVEQGRSTTNS